MEQAIHTEQAINDYKSFLQSVVAEHSNLVNRKAIYGNVEKIQHVREFTKIYNKKATDKANELLKAHNCKDGKLKQELLLIGMEYYNVFTQEHFPWVNPI